MKDVGSAREIFEQYRRVAEPDDVRTQALLIEAADGVGGLFQRKDAAFQQIWAMYMDISKPKRAYATQQLLRVNREAAVFVAQFILKSAGFYGG